MLFAILTRHCIILTWKQKYGQKNGYCSHFGINSQPPSAKSPIMPSILLRSCDDMDFSVDMEIPKRSVTIKDMLENLGIEEVRIEQY